MLGHIVKRGMAHLQGVSPEYMAKLQADAELYDNAGPEMEVNPSESLPVLITGIVVFLILVSIRYTLGDVVASLAMIESPSTTAIVEKKEPAYADEELLIPAEMGTDVEITFINHKPITASLRSTMAHLRRVGGCLSRWRGACISILYHVLHAAFVLVLGGNPLVSLLASILLSPVHMLWTHSMILPPSTARLIPFKQCIAPLVLPTVVVALAQQATFLLPVFVGYLLLDLPNLPDHALSAAQRDDPLTLALLALRILAVPASAALLAFFVLLPASATLTRIEASLLPADVHPIVPFDSSFAFSVSEPELRLSKRALFVAAWRSFDRSARLRVLKVYAKMVFVQTTVAFLGVAVMAAEIYVIGGERLAIFYTSTRAQLELMALERNGGL
ncbi:hypothetical protein B0H14DRAFT_2712134 [Mycena olivaceomarginata]|nr:hypothetical protein B0H14DRAFT_2712134 [Mycena olivaceomarginata]